jgi:molybdopterin molybdotransferase
LPKFLGIARDNLDGLRSSIGEGLANHAVLVLSGGVSVGERDLVPKVLAELGVEPHFHQVALKPGKPLFFGTRGHTLVFGLPGNPAGAFVGFELFVRPAIHALRGVTPPGPRSVEATLAVEFVHRGDRPTYHPAKLETVGGSLRVRPVAWLGSPDLRALAGADCLAVFSAGNATLPAGQVVSVVLPEG